MVFLNGHKVSPKNLGIDKDNASFWYLDKWSDQSHDEKQGIIFDFESKHQSEGKVW